ncbi:ABC transporter substrate-binding protein [Bradyrhizobium sp. CCBAU 53421]|uniref:ABC transporter substrate-binding protein n=1 Tax=Bradyrhizobium sp. CCBAU 53421 TaxID=1325120 RepID=UPI00188C3B4E|nr:ABC transporter substrate-binding protein [Bradyrhizobium sp. CCBAU 53421]
MTMRKFGSSSNSGLSRRTVLQSTAGLLSVPLVGRATVAWAQEKLAGSGEVVVFSVGGPFTEGVRRNVYDPFTKATGIKVVDVVADEAEPQAMAMFRAGKIDWDVIDVQSSNYPSMNAAGMFAPIDYSLWDQESLDGVPSRSRLQCGVTRYSSGVVVGYDERAFPKGGPKNWADFWDVKKFPGPRGLDTTNVRYNFVFALLADGVARKDVWPLTDDKLDRAFKKLDEIRPHISKWWTAGGEAPQLLINREYVMTSIFDGRAISAIRQGAPIKFSWVDAYVNYSPISAIMKNGPNTANAQKYIAFMNRAQIAAGFTQGTGYPSPNTNQLKYLPADLIPLLSVNPENSSKIVVQDSEWLAVKRSDGKTNLEHLRERWLAWRAK